MSERLALIVEDDSRLSIIFGEAVRQAGYRILPCLNGAQVRECLSNVERPHLILMDLHLPDVSGVDLLHEIRANPQYNDTIIVLATADPLLANLYREQADFLLVKPISFSQLRDLATRLITGRRPGKTGSLSMPPG